MPLTDKIALITGGATGIGRAAAELFAAQGATVLIVDYNQEEGRAAVQAIETAGGRAVFFRHRCALGRKRRPGPGPDQRRLRPRRYLGVQRRRF